MPAAIAENSNNAFIEGTVESIIYHSDENGFTVFTIQLENPSSTENIALDEFEDGVITCTAFLPDIREGEVMKLAGSFVNNPRYGRQLSVSHAEKTVPSSLEGIEKYLGSGVIKGVGVRTAKRIVALFGAETFAVIEEQPEKLTQIRGINLEKAMRISEAFHAQAALRGAMIFLQDYGISPVSAMKIYKRYKENTVDIVKNNPYRLADDIDGIGFKTADAIACRIGIPPNASARISAGVRYVLWEAADNGHTYLPAGMLVKHAEALLGIETELIENELLHMQMDRLLHRENMEGMSEPVVFLSAFYYAELTVARKLASLSGDYMQENSARKSMKKNDTLQSIKAIERETGMVLSEGQRDAVSYALDSGVLIITGGPGTGKTTAINTIIGLLENRGLKVSLSAPTGRAAKRMTEATGREAKTIHRLLESSFIAEDSRKQIFNRNEENPLEADVLIVDESSMMDILLTQSLLKAVAPGTRLILVGDVDQLPSVGPGNVLKDLINSECLTVVRLKEIFRQSQESAIVMNAHRINRGEYPALNEKERDFFFIRRGRAEDVTHTIIELVTKRLPAYKKLDIINDIQVLTPMRKSSLGVENLNTLLQHRLNPPSSRKKEREFRSMLFREGDKIMQIKNNYDIAWKIYDENGRRLDEGEGVFNGDTGMVKKIDETHEIITVLFDDNRQVDYDFSQLDELVLAYAITIHKSQGSEYRVVIIPIHSGPPMLLNRNLLYTAVTRARELAVLIGLPETLHRMVDNDWIAKRYTALARRLQNIFSLS